MGGGKICQSRWKGYRIYNDIIYLLTCAHKWKIFFLRLTRRLLVLFAWLVDHTLNMHINSITHVFNIKNSLEWEILSLSIEGILIFRPFGVLWAFTLSLLIKIQILFIKQFDLFSFHSFSPSPSSFSHRAEYPMLTLDQYYLTSLCYALFTLRVSI